MPLGGLPVGGLMTFFEDGSAYRYLPEAVGTGAINIGWLDAQHVFTTGEVSTAFVDKLLRLCRSPLFRTRGFHRCNLCETASARTVASGMTIATDAGEFVVGGAEIRVVAENGRCFAAPDMVIHYVLAHEYRPPAPFVAAVLNSGETDSTPR